MYQLAQSIIYNSCFLSLKFRLLQALDNCLYRQYNNYYRVAKLNFTRIDKHTTRTNFATCSWIRCGNQATLGRKKNRSINDLFGFDNDRLTFFFLPSNTHLI